MEGKKKIKAGAVIIETPSTISFNTLLYDFFFELWNPQIENENNFFKGLSRHGTRDGGKRKVESGRRYYWDAIDCLSQHFIIRFFFGFVSLEDFTAKDKRWLRKKIWKRAKVGALLLKRHRLSFPALRYAFHILIRDLFSWDFFSQRTFPPQDEGWRQKKSWKRALLLLRRHRLSFSTPRTSRAAASRMCLKTSKVSTNAPRCFSVSHMWMSHVTHVEESCHTCKCVMSPVWMGWFLVCVLCIFGIFKCPGPHFKSWKDERWFFFKETAHPCQKWASLVHVQEDC